MKSTAHMIDIMIATLLRSLGGAAIYSRQVKNEGMTQSERSLI
jgi:hypothetical protein